MVDKPPSEDKTIQCGARPWESPETKVNLTLTRGAYRPYSTCVVSRRAGKLCDVLILSSVKPKYSAWDPVAHPRDGSKVKTPPAIEGPGI